jgi:hypothetical protein
MRVALFRALVGVVALVALGLFATGAWLVLDDLGQSGEMFDGLGAAIGAGVMIVAALAGVMAVVAMRIARRRPTAARVIGVLLAVSALGLVYPFGVDTDWGWWLAPLPLALLVVSVLPDPGPSRPDADVPGWGRSDR